MASVSLDAQQAPSTVGTAGSSAGSPRPPSSATREVPMEASWLPSTTAGPEMVNSVPSSSRCYPPLLRPRSPPSPRPSNQAVVVARAAAERWSGQWWRPVLVFLFSLKNVCRVFFFHSAKCLPSTRQKILGKECLPRNLYRVLVAECNTLCRVFVWLCQVPLALGKPPVSCSVYFIYFFVPGSQAK